MRLLVGLLFYGVCKSEVVKVGVRSREFRDCVFEFCGWKCCPSGRRDLFRGGKEGGMPLSKKGEGGGDALLKGGTSRVGAKGRASRNACVCL